ncbi:MAG: hypothetical protein HC784_15145, partial [Hydrococcus sp. CSU_1_8]|nr:hypothetical protein [Hydrococcus sp. CSU_1_8]
NIINIFFFIISYFPDYLGHSDNYILSNQLVTPNHIVPEWYFLPFYAILRSVPNKSFGVILLLLAILFLFIALEEVSWGQTFFKWETPDFLEEVNVQQETSLHNLVWFHYSLRDAIIVVSFLGGVSWWLASLFKLTHKFKQFIKYLIPDWYLSSFFIVSFILSAILKFQDILTFFISKDQEFAELILSLGFLLFVLTNYFRQSFSSLKLRE